MDFYRDNTIKVLKELIRNCTFAETLLRNSAKEFNDENLRKIFLYYADQNQGYIKKLNSEIIRLGGTVDDLSVETTFYDNSIKDIKEHFRACEHSVNTVVKNYKEISMREDILWEVVPVIARQYYGEKEAQERIQIISRAT